MNRHSHIPQPNFQTKKKVRPNMTEKQPTLSYSKLKVEVSSLQEENRDLKQKVAKHQAATSSSKTAVLDLQKENKELKQRLEEDDKQHKESVSHCQEETQGLESKLRNFEEALEKSGINPVTLVALEHDQEQRRQVHSDAVARVQVLREKLEENTYVWHSNSQEMKKISDKCRAMMENARSVDL
ncbi:huntingtin-interacting protein 1-like [Strongylocentrotus purpuratus]|uniref:Uncharacterized protein n=1 Tax=Strongylocentrotus purpuratus TaxID=7668 RepID=A0A7M7T5I3_STRPU|nr:huntingtin-interacting protein 1-like [Strongylocentrotus purpuratus]|eukprot:XP_011666924.1 PREDICTED: huntingtin-interacting protein 1-like isoform X1 [Strongylocentrotus purpuratus]